MATQVYNEIKNNNMKWQSYAEPGSIENIISNCNQRGFKFLPGKYHPIIRKIESSRVVSTNFKIQRKN
jgi:hypothetical protein